MLSRRVSNSVATFSCKLPRSFLCSTEQSSLKAYSCFYVVLVHTVTTFDITVFSLSSIFFLVCRLSRRRCHIWSFHCSSTSSQLALHHKSVVRPVYSFAHLTPCRTFMKYALRPATVRRIHTFSNYNDH